ncbi:zinc finger protein 862-like [Corticium candelabrum]|uniref:zinc finger protein 862-like n=1 Tax=Corticium candelabrum TaxID=121492 RepID=UPI002E258948|nr:zinc finger protein 862-like [Corticium candelabrum]
MKLSGVQPNVLRAFMMSRSLYTEAIGKCIHNRSDDLQQGFFKAVCLLDTNLWPTDRDDLAPFDVADVSLAVKHFRCLLLKNNVLLDGVMTDWTFFKMYWIDNLRHHPKNTVWSLLLSQYKEKFPNFVQLVCILLVFPVSNALVERGFSAMRRIKSDWRSSLSEDAVDHLMRISVDGPPLAQFDPTLAVQQFFNTPRRPHVQPYG